MSRTEKLFRKLVDRRKLNFGELQTLLQALGFTLERVRGSHHIYRHPMCRDQLNIQPSGKDAKPYQLRQLMLMIEEHGLTPDAEE